eukprot:409789-Prorocentrum_minimum.AAC.1
MFHHSRMPWRKGIRRGSGEPSPETQGLGTTAIASSCSKHQGDIHPASPRALVVQVKSGEWLGAFRSARGLSVLATVESLVKDVSGAQQDCEPSFDCCSEYCSAVGARTKQCRQIYTSGSSQMKASKHVTTSSTLGWFLLAALFSRWAAST